MLRKAVNGDHGEGVGRHDREHEVWSGASAKAASSEPKELNCMPIIVRSARRYTRLYSDLLCQLKQATCHLMPRTNSASPQLTARDYLQLR